MAQKNNKPNKLKQFLSGLISKIDKKMEEKSKSSSCCDKPSDGKNKSCCS
jgi:hypothetical protein